MLRQQLYILIGACIFTLYSLLYYLGCRTYLDFFISESLPAVCKTYGPVGFIFLDTLFLYLKNSQPFLEATTLGGISTMLMLLYYVLILTFGYSLDFVHYLLNSEESVSGETKTASHYVGIVVYGSSLIIISVFTVLVTQGYLVLKIGAVY